MKTKSEVLFEAFLAANNLPFEKIEEKVSSPRPDYRVSIGHGEIIFEVKQLEEDGNFGVVKDPTSPDIKSSSRAVGRHIRRRIRKSKEQIEFGAEQGLPSILLIYNKIDPAFQYFGTELTDFIAAMYGTYTVNGMDRTPDESDNASFSAVGHLCDRGGTTTVKLYENVFAKVKVPWGQLPECFDVQSFDVTTHSRGGSV